MRPSTKVQENDRKMIFFIMVRENKNTFLSRNNQGRMYKYFLHSLTATQQKNLSFWLPLWVLTLFTFGNKSQWIGCNSCNGALYWRNFALIDLLDLAKLSFEKDISVWHGFKPPPSILSTFFIFLLNYDRPESQE